MQVLQTTLPEINVSFDPGTDIRKRLKITSSEDAYQACKSIWNEDTIMLYEEFIALFLDRQGGVVGYRTMGVGTAGQTLVNIPLLFAIAIKSSVQGIILAHNHPSAKLSPSDMDKQLTERLVKAAKLLDLKILDHLIITSQGYFSFADESMI